MTILKFSQGRNTYDNQPAQCSASDFDDFASQISQTGSTRKGEAYICAPMAEGPHSDTLKYPHNARWRLHILALPRLFLALDADYVADSPTFAAFQELMAQWSSLVYTTASHTPTVPRARAIIELSRPVDRAEGIALGEAVERIVTGALGAGNIKLDPSVYRAEQPVYTPLVSAQTYRHHGRPMDVDAILVAYPPQGLVMGGAANSMAQMHALTSPVAGALLQPPETPTEIAKAQAALAVVSSDCSYPEWIEILFALHSTGWNCAEPLARGWSMGAPHRYDPVAFDSAWQHAKPFGGISIATLYHRAKQVRLNVAQASPISGLQQNAALAIQPNLTAGQLNIPTVPPPPRVYLFGNVVVPGTVAVLAGAGGTAKTGLAMQICIHGALGRDLGSIQAGSFASLMILAEETPGERDRRFGALCSRMSAQDRARVEQMIHCRAEAGNDLRLTALADGNVIETQWVDHTIALAQTHAAQAHAKLGVIVIDHARLVMSGDPISSDHVTALLRALNKIAVNTGSAVLLLAHSPKSTINKDTEADASEVFGSGAFVDHSRAAFVMHTMREKEAKHFGFGDKQRKEHVSLSVVKANYGSSNQQWWLRKDVVDRWQVVELVPVFLLPKGQAQTHSALVRRIVDMIKAEPGKLTRRALRDRSGVKRVLGASERDVGDALQRALKEGLLTSREPSDVERRQYKLSANVHEVLDLP
jgi:RecA-family ATPase